MDPNAPYFVSLEIENVRCFASPKQTLDLSRNGKPARWTLILGDNNSGKTTLLRALASMTPVAPPIRPGALAGVSPRAFHHELPEPRDGTDTAHLKLELVDGSVWEMSRSGAAFQGTQRSALTEAPISSWAWGASRSMGRITLTPDEAVDPVATLFSTDKQVLNAEEWLLRKDYESRQTNGAGARARRHLRFVLDMIRTEPRLLPDVSDARLEPPDKVFFRTPDGWVRLAGLSLGYQTMLAFTIDLAHRLFELDPDGDNPLARACVVLVDEIDLHLHPRWQRKILSSLTERFPNAQFVATAHSPLVVQSADDDTNIVVLRREGDHVVIETAPDVVRNWRADQILSSDLFGGIPTRSVRFDELFRERDALLEKRTLSLQDEARLAELAREIGDLPTGDTAADIAAADLVRRVAADLRAKGHA